MLAASRRGLKAGVRTALPPVNPFIKLRLSGRMPGVMLQGGKGGSRGMLLERLDERLAVGRAIRDRASETVARRGRLAETAAWAAARAPGLSDRERAFREAVAIRVSRMFAFVGIERQH